MNFKVTIASILLSLSFVSCCPDREEDFCTLHFLQEFEMKAYEGEELGCKTHIRIYEFEGTMFAYMINHCADFAPFTIYDCDGDEFCYTSIGPCHIQESIDHGIIGIER